MSIGVRTDYRGECELCRWAGEWTRDEEVARRQFRDHWESVHLKDRLRARVGGA